MKPIGSYIDPESDEFRIQKSEYQYLISDFYRKTKSVVDRRTDPSVVRHIHRGKLYVRDRIELLIDQNSPFLELSALAADGQYDDQFPSAGIVTGIGLVHGKPVMIVANDATVKGGTYVRETLKKHIRAQEIALQNHLPCIYLVDSGGIFLPEQANLFADRFHFGRIFNNQALLSSEGIPQISVVMGSCTAGGAYVPAMSDETIIVANQGTIFIGGPPLVKAATGEEVSAEDLGGGDVHTSISGLADHLAENDVEALRKCREIFETIQPATGQRLDRQDSKSPLFSAEDLYALAPIDLKKPVLMHQIISRLVDASEFNEFKPRYGTTIIAGFAHIMGYPAGILANNGFLTSESSIKAAHFIELCNFRRIPILFLQNITGFIVGKKYEHEGIARAGSKLIHAVATATVPKITVIVGGSYGAGNYAMSGRAYDPHFLFMWPNAKIGVMGGEQAAGVLQSVSKKTSHQPDLVGQVDLESTAYYSTSRLWDDGIIDPAKTRDFIGIAIAVSLNRTWLPVKTGIYRM